MKNQMPLIMKYAFLLFILISLVACQHESNTSEKIATAVQNNNDSLKNIIPEKSVVPFVSKEGRFSILFPDSPSIKKKTINSPEVGQIRLTQFFYERESTQAWLASYSDYPKQMIRLGSNERLLKGIRNQILHSLGSRAINPLEIKLADTYEGIEFEAYSPTQKMDIIYRIYLVDNRVYQLAMFSSIGKFSEETIHAFMNSFTLIPTVENALEEQSS